MNNWKQIALSATRAAHGPEARVRLYRHRGRALTMAYQDDQEDATEKVLALATGADPEEAWRNLIERVSRPDRDLTTREAAAVLGVTPGRLRHMLRQQKLMPVARGARGRLTARFSPVAVWRAVQARGPEPDQGGQ